jgi:response regulator RpfG family c-di-GMP phosphodiesterase
LRENMELTIVVVEDDHQDAIWISGELQASLSANVEVILCERDFVAKLPALGQQRPDLIIFDVMLRWATSSEELEREVEEGKVPENVIQEGFIRAGLRCVARLKSYDDTKDIPYLVYTGLQTNHFTEEVIHVADIITKSDDIKPLIAAVRNKLAQGRNTK